MVMRQCKGRGRMVSLLKQFAIKANRCVRLLVSSLELLWDIHGCPAPKSKAPWIRVRGGYKARAVRAPYRYNNNKLFHGETVKGINMVLSSNTPTVLATQTKLIMQLRWDLFSCFNLTLICSWRWKLAMWQCNYCMWFQRDMEPPSPLPKGNVLTSTVAVAAKHVRRVTVRAATGTTRELSRTTTSI